MSAQGKRYSTELRTKSKLYVFWSSTVFFWQIRSLKLTMTQMIYRIPGVVTRGASGKPIMIEMDPRIIHVLMKGPTTRFLGRRYILVCTFIPNLTECYVICDEIRLTGI